MLLAKALSACNAVLGGLDIDEARIASNLDMLHGMLFSEALMFHAGKKIGKQTAHHMIRDMVLSSSGAPGKTFRELVLENAELKRIMTPEELDGLMDYSKHIGTSGRQVEAVSALSLRLRVDDAEFDGPQPNGDRYDDTTGEA